MPHSPSHSTTSSSSSSSMAPPQPPSSTPGILHHVHPVSAFEVNPSSTSTNLLLWIGGLTDTYHSVSYVYTLAASLPSSWSLAQANLSSAGSGWGIASLSQDVNEISSLVSYFRSQGKQKVVIMGHSTGCQDCLHYFASEVHNSDHREIVDGAILQASVSDREAIAMDMDPSELESTNTTAKDWCSNGKGEHILPLSLTASNFGHNPVSARRWVSLACVGGEDDYFSSDLPDSTLEKTFGRVDKPLLILYGEEDEYVPKSVDRKALVNRWIPFVKGRVDEQSRELLGGASHNLNGDDQEVVDELVKRVGRFLSSI